MPFVEVSPLSSRPSVPARLKIVKEIAARRYAPDDPYLKPSLPGPLAHLLPQHDERLVLGREHPELNPYDAVSHRDEGREGDLGEGERERALHRRVAVVGAGDVCSHVTSGESQCVRGQAPNAQRTSCN